MDDTLQELENELKRLRPCRPTSALTDRVGQQLSPGKSARRYTTATSLRSWKWAGWTLAGVAAALALVAVVNAPRKPTPTAANEVAATVAPRAPATRSANRYEPVRASSVLYDLKDDGVAYLPDKTPARQVRYRYMDTYTWKNPATKASLKWSVPREEVRLVRASLD